MTSVKTQRYFNHFNKLSVTGQFFRNSVQVRANLPERLLVQQAGCTRYPDGESIKTRRSSSRWELPKKLVIGFRCSNTWLILRIFKLIFERWFFTFTCINMAGICYICLYVFFKPWESNDLPFLSILSNILIENSPFSIAIRLFMIRIPYFVQRFWQKMNWKRKHEKFPMLLRLMIIVNSDLI